MFTIALALPTLAQDKSNSILLVHAGQLNTDNGGFPNDGDETYFSYWNYTDGGIQYAAEYLKGMLNLTEDYAELEVDFYRATQANSLADVYYDPQFSSVRDMIGDGYKYVIFFDSEQAYAYPEVMYEACTQLSKLVLKSGGTPMLMMYRSDHVDTTTLGEYCYRAANGAGIEVIPASYAYDQEGVQGRHYASGYTTQAMINASAILRTITGVRAETLNYYPTFEHAGITSPADNLSAADISRLTALGADMVDTHKTTEHYSTSYENDGAVVYRKKALSSELFENTIRYYYKGTSTHDFTFSRLNTLISGASYTPAGTKWGKITYNERFWTSSDTSLRTSALNSEANANKGLFLYASGSTPGTLAQDLIDQSQPNLTPLVFDWIKDFNSSSGTASTVAALNGEDCANLWSHYHFRGWKTIPLTIGMGRLNEAIPNFSAADDALHASDPLVYMNASMMVASATARKLPITTTLPIRRGSWTQSQLELAVEMGHDIIKELAYMSETSAFVPDSDLSIDTASLPDCPPSGSYSHQLVASGGTGGYHWEVLPDTTLPTGLSLSVNGLLYGTLTEEGVWNVAFKVTDSVGAFRKVGMKLTSSASAEAADFTVLLSSYDPATITLPGDDSGGLTYAFTHPSNGVLSGTAPDLSYTPNAGITEDSFTYTMTSGGVTSEVKTVLVKMALPDGQGVGAPVAYSSSTVVNERNTVAIPLTGLDSEGDALIARIISQPANGNIVSISDNVVIYEPNWGYYGADSFTFKLNDGLLDSATATISIRVNAVPVAVSYDDETLKDEPVAFSLSATDRDGESLSYLIVTQPEHGQLSGTLPNVVYTPDLGFQGTDSFSYVANDGTTDSEVATVSIKVYTVPDIVSAVAGTGYHLEGSEVTGFRSTGVSKSMDVDGDDAYGSAGYFFYGNGVDKTSNSNGMPSWVTLVDEHETVAVNAAYADFDNPTEPIAEVVADWTVTSFSNERNDTAGAWAELLSFTVDATVPRSFRLGVLAGNEGNTDGRWDPAAFRISSNGAVASVSGLGTDLGMVFFDITLSEGFVGTFTIEGQTRDAAVVRGPALAGVVIDITPERNTAPVVESFELKVPYDTATALSLVGFDVDNDTLSYTIVTPPAHGSLSGSGANLIYTPNAGYQGTDSFSYLANDGVDDSSIATVSIDVVKSLRYSFESPGNISGAGSTLVYTAPDSNTLGTGVSVSALELSDGDNASTHYGRIRNIGGDSVEAAVGDRAEANTIEFTLTIADDVIVDLTHLSFDTSYFTSATGTSVMDWTFETVVGATSGNVTTGGFSHDGEDDYQSPESASGAIALNGLSGLNDTSVTFRWTLNGDKNHNFGIRTMGLDNIVLTGYSEEASSYGLWLAHYGLSGDAASATADSENGGAGDGYSNLLEFALGMDPTQYDAGSREAAYTEEEGGDAYFVYEYDRRTDYQALGLNYAVVVTEDLKAASGETPYDVLVGSAVGGFETVKTRFPIDVDAKFIHLEVEQTSE
ncbi:Ig-like domain-containing protein [Rubritalea spongiae]|uniref:Ig-like domain-containing protein n=1 Tax=Rubritalea spongiae TaxID=430797 RepID=UPI00366D600F